MLGKLMKHEWKGTYRVGCLMLIVLMGITFFGWLAFQSPMWQSLAKDSYYYDSRVTLLDIVSIFTLMLYLIMLVAVSVGIIVFLAVHFYKTMYTDEGYLTHTLPVTKNNLLFSKIFISGVWVLILLLAVYVSIFALLNFMFGTILPDEYSVWEFWRMFSKEFGDAIAEAIREGLGINLTVYGIYFIVSILISPFITIIILFGAISMGQLFTKHRVLMAIVSYIGVMIINGILSSIIEGIFTAAYVDGNSARALGGYFNTNLICSAVINIVIAVVMYLVSWYVSAKKLNME